MRGHGSIVGWGFRPRPQGGVTDKINLTGMWGVILMSAKSSMDLSRSEPSGGQVLRKRFGQIAVLWFVQATTLFLPAGSLGWGKAGVNLGSMPPSSRYARLCWLRRIRAS